LPPKETFAHWEYLGMESLDQLYRRITRIVSFHDIALLGTPVGPGEFQMEKNSWTTTSKTSSKRQIDVAVLEASKTAKSSMDINNNNEIIID